MLFYKADEVQILNVKRTLRIFQVMSGLKINFRKSSLVGVGVDQKVVEAWANSICCRKGELPLTYLGPPLGAKVNSVSVWKSLVEKFERRLAGWKAGCLSLSGRLTLIKSVLGSLPIFFMSLFQIPCSVKEKLDAIQRRFLWGGNQSTRKVNWVRWEQVCKNKDHDGLGIIDLSLKNRALLNKWIWRYSMEDDALWRRVVDSIYGGSRTDLLPPICNQRKFSRIWRNVTQPLRISEEFSDTFIQGLGFLLGNGEKISFWHDEWIPGVVLKWSFPRIYALACDKEVRVAEYGCLVNSLWTWEIPLRRGLFAWEKDVWNRFWA
ncbi:hypothetical protein PTKIN_Ptkin03bG0245600 [Pterospermum kingtungense]